MTDAVRRGKDLRTDQERFQTYLSPEYRQLAHSIMGPSEDQEGVENTSELKRMLRAYGFFPVLIREVPVHLDEKRYLVDMLPEFRVTVSFTQQEQCFVMSLFADLPGESFSDTIVVHHDDVNQEGRLSPSLRENVFGFFGLWEGMFEIQDLTRRDVHQRFKQTQ